MSIRAKLILSTAIPLLLIYSLVLAWDYVLTQRVAMEQSERMIAVRADAAAAQINGQLDTLQQAVRASAEAISGRPSNTERQLRGTVNNAMRGGRSSAAWVLFDPATTRPANIPPILAARRGGGEPRDGSAASDLVRQTWFQQIKSTGKSAWFEPDDFTSPDGEKACLYAEPFFNSDNIFAGVVCAQIHTAELQNLRNERSIIPRLRAIGQRAPIATAIVPSTASYVPTPISQGGYFLIDQHGDLISHPDGQTIHDVLSLMKDPKHGELSRAIDNALKGTGDVVSAGDLDKILGGFTAGEEYVLALAPITSTGWLYVTAIPKSELVGPIRTILIRRGIFLLSSLFVVVGVLMFVIARFCRPIEQMAATVDKLARGQLDIEPIPVKARDELGQLARGFNSMTTQLRDHVTELTAQTAEREKVQSELRIARQIQRDLLPSRFPPFPDRNEFTLHAVNIPARHIAGDFFDFFFTEPDLLTIAIADVSGKGVPAALMMAVTRTMVRNMAVNGLGPQAIVERANRLLVEDTNPGLFVTMVVGQYRVSTGEFIYVNAGHPPAVRYSSGATATTCCDPTGPLVGVDASGELGPFEEASITLSPGEGLLFYTDGVTEAHDTANVFFGEARLLSNVSQLCALSTRDLCEKLVKDVLAFQHQAMTDDLTLVNLQRR